MGILVYKTKSSLQIYSSPPWHLRSQLLSPHYRYRRKLRDTFIVVGDTAPSSERNRASSSSKESVNMRTPLPLLALSPMAMDGSFLAISVVLKTRAPFGPMGRFPGSPLRTRLLRSCCRIPSNLSITRVLISARDSVVSCTSTDAATGRLPGNVFFFTYSSSESRGVGASGRYAIAYRANPPVVDEGD